MIKLFLTPLVALLIVGCGEPTKYQVVEVKVLQVITEDTKWGCIGTDKKTLVEVKELGFRQEICGYKGEVGDTFKACWVSGKFDPVLNGLRSYCNN